MESAVLWVPAGPEAGRWERVNTEYCETREYEIISMILADPSSTPLDGRASTA